MFPNNIRAEMARFGMAQMDLAAALNVSTSTVKNWMVCKTDIPSGALIKMAKLWGVTVDYLLGLDSVGNTIKP